MPSIISADFRITGDIVSEQDLQVEGNIVGNVKSRMLTVGASASIEGDITADQVNVNGKVIGKIKARTVTLGQSARVNGDITYESLTMDPGTRFEGSCKLGNSGK